MSAVAPVIHDRVVQPAVARARVEPACGSSYACSRSTITSEAQRSFIAFVELFFLWALDMRSGGLEGHAFFRMEFHVNGVADGRAQRRMASREQDAAAELHLEIDEFAQKHPSGRPSRPRRCPLEAVPRRAPRPRAKLKESQGRCRANRRRQHFDLAELGAHAEMPGARETTSARSIRRPTRGPRIPRRTVLGRGAAPGHFRVAHEFGEVEVLSDEICSQRPCDLSVRPEDVELAEERLKGQRLDAKVDQKVFLANSSISR